MLQANSILLSQMPFNELVCGREKHSGFIALEAFKVPGL